MDFLYTGQASGLKDSKEQLFDLGEQYELPGKMTKPKENVQRSDETPKC